MPWRGLFKFNKSIPTKFPEYFSKPVKLSLFLKSLSPICKSNVKSEPKTGKYSLTSILARHKGTNEEILTLFPILNPYQLKLICCFSLEQNKTG